VKEFTTPRSHNRIRTIEIIHSIAKPSSDRICSEQDRGQPRSLFSRRDGVEVDRRWTPCLLSHAIPTRPFFHSCIGLRQCRPNGIELIAKAMLENPMRTIHSSSNETFRSARRQRGEPKRARFASPWGSHLRNIASVPRQTSRTPPG
jgi:hypothetical protein